jgi:hypothetical protein
MDHEEQHLPSQPRPTRSPSRPVTAPSRQPAGGESRPRDLSLAEQSLARSQGAGVAAPTLEPPARAEGASGATSWQRNRRVAAMWANDQPRNSWIYIEGGGWLHLAGASDSAVLALTILGAVARQTRAGIDYRTEADGLIHEIYVW